VSQSLLPLPDGFAATVAAMHRAYRATEALEPLPAGVDPAAAEVLVAWFGFGREVLVRLRGEAHVSEAPTEPVLWPEHFDVAIEMGSEALGARATYGFSPGDENHPEPYAYVAPWRAQPPGELWNARGFGGAELGYAELLAGGDPWRAALDFLRSRREALAQGQSDQRQEEGK
jgi:hypothetical protein